MSDTKYVAVASEDRHPPVIAVSPHRCAEKATEKFDLRHSASDLSNWRKRSNLSRDARGKSHWRIKVKAHSWEYASIHEVSNGE